MFTSVLTIDKKEQVLKLFTEPEGNLRLLVATTSFGMGIDCPDIRRIIHWGVPTTVEEYAQETGRAGRDGKLAVAILYEGVGEKYADAKMKAYLTNHKTCRRVYFKILLCFQKKMSMTTVLVSVVIYVHVNVLVMSNTIIVRN